jgi:hypothetical protein
MSALQLYRGPVVEVRYARRQGSPLSVSLVISGVTYLYAQPSDFLTLRAWWAAELEKMDAFMGEPEDVNAAENLRGD